MALNENPYNRLNLILVKNRRDVLMNQINNENQIIDENRMSDFSVLSIHFRR